MKKLILIPLIATLSACSSMKEVEVRKTAANPNWYVECEQRGKEGWFWAREGYVYSCGMGMSKYIQASEAQADAFALDSFAKRIGSRVNSLTKVETSTNNTLIQNQMESKKYQYVLNGQYHTYVRLKMTEDTFNRLSQQGQ